MSGDSQDMRDKGVSMSKDSDSIWKIIVFFFIAWCVYTGVTSFISAKRYLYAIPIGKMPIMEAYQSGLEYMHENIDNWTWDDFKSWHKDSLHRQARIMKYGNQVLRDLERMGQL